MTRSPSERPYITKIIGGGQSWLYLIIDGRIAGAAHQDDRDGYARLRAALSEKGGT